MAGISKLLTAKKGSVEPQTKPENKITVLIDGKPYKKVKEPKMVATAADNLYILRAQRLAVQKVVEEIEAEEKAQKEYLINNLPKSQASGAIGRVACAKLETKEKPRVVDWQAFYAYIKKNNRFDLLQKRVSEPAVIELWEDKKVVPGAEKFSVITVSCTKK